MAARKKKAPARKKTGPARKKPARKKAAKPEPAQASGSASSHADPMRDLARSFSARLLR